MKTAQRRGQGRRASWFRTVPVGQGGISNGMDLVGFSSDDKRMITGAVLLLAVTVDAAARRGRITAGIA
jgi:hypothetical protein